MRDNVEGKKLAINQFDSESSCICQRVKKLWSFMIFFDHIAKTIYGIFKDKVFNEDK